MLGDHNSSGGLIKTKDSPKSTARQIKEDLADKAAKSWVAQDELVSEFQLTGNWIAVEFGTGHTRSL